jgi:hypothetical protein
VIAEVKLENGRETVFDLPMNAGAKPMSFTITRS